MASTHQNRFVVISGCSGGGKSTLLAELARRGYATIEEPGRRIVVDELQNGGTALPWLNLEAFLRRAIEVSLADRASAAAFQGWVFFDRGLIDAAAGLQHVSGEQVLKPLVQAHPYHARVFLTPPWAEIFTTDDERRHSWVDAVAEYDRLLEAYSSIGYQAIPLPKISVTERADLVLETLAERPIRIALRCESL
jgi:predicted ATPase